MKLKIYIFCVILLVSGCHPLFCIWDMGYDNITRLDTAKIIGKYKLNTHSYEIMKYEGNYKNIPVSVLEIKSDGYYRLTNAPDWLMNSFGAPKGAYIDKTGQWTFNCDGQTCYLNLDGLQTGELLVKKVTKLFVLLTIGDPDSCQGMVYQKM